MHRKSVYGLILAVATLIVIGCVMLYSTSAFVHEKGKSPFYYIKHQSVWLCIGLIACFIASKTDYLHWRRVAWLIYGVAAVLLLLCFVPGIGMKLNGAYRWLNLGFASLQPSELAKLAVVTVIARWFTQKECDPQSFVKGFLAPMGIAAGLMTLIVFEVDMGSTALIGATAFGIMFIAGTRLSIIAPIFAGGITMMIYAATHMTERMGRLLAFLDLEKYKEGAGLQQYQALIAFGSGGVDGLGLGLGRQKMGYLPYAQTDFIFPTIGEELGLRFTLLVVFCYVVIVLCGSTIALRARDRFGMLMGFGVVLLIALQAAVNIGVTTALLPNKGMPLPFISYGGTNLAFCLLCVGILINIYRRGLSEKEFNRGSAKLEVKPQQTSRAHLNAMNFVIAAGGTGGHLFPGLAVGEVLLQRGHAVMLLISEKEIDALATQGRSEFRVEKVRGVGLDGKSPLALLRFWSQFRAGLNQVKALIRDFSPSAVLGMGGFTSTAPILAGRSRRIPTFVHESNAIPGKANKLNARLVTRVLLGFAECAKFFSAGKCEVTGTPIRRTLTERIPKAQALEAFGLSPERRTLLVMGGSQGARGINTAVVDALPQLRTKPVQIIHLTGRDDEQMVREKYAQAGVPAFVSAFWHKMETAYSAADFCIARSGAASLTELSHFALPSILIPYPFAAEDHQTLNARIFERAGAAVLLPQREIAGDALAKKLLWFLDEPTRLSEMSACCLKLAPQHAAERVADVLLGSQPSTSNPC